jgi:hypothetical protein
MPNYVLSPKTNHVKAYRRLGKERRKERKNDLPIMPAMPPFTIFGSRANCWAAGNCKVKINPL